MQDIGNSEHLIEFILDLVTDTLCCEEGIVEGTTEREGASVEEENGMDEHRC
jgi:hypothetical protein